MTGVRKSLLTVPSVGCEATVTENGRRWKGHTVSYAEFRPASFL